MKYNKFKDKKITVMGLGISGGGIGTARFFCDMGANVTVTDLKTKKELRESILELRKYKIKYVLGRHRVKDFKNADLVIYGPGVRKDSKYLRIARKNKIKLDTDISIFFKFCPCPIIGITGTKGKSTITTIIYQLLKSHRKNVYAGGNIQKSVLDILPKLNSNSIVVLELSSWQLEGLAKIKKSPHIALITNILQDHLNTYKNFGEYVKAKKIIYKYQEKKDKIIFNYDDKKLHSISGKNINGNIEFYSLDKKLPGATVYMEDNKIIYGGKEICRVDELSVKGNHNLLHILGALTAISDYKIPINKIRKVIINFKGMFGRIEFIKKIKKVEYFNDTTATNPDAVIAAINTFFNKRKNIVLIFGGVDKNLDSYRELAQEMKKSIKSIILLPGTATKKMVKELRSRKIIFPIIEAVNMKDAVLKAQRASCEGDIVILSPGGSSFNLFKNEFDRGEQFINAVNNL